MTCRNGMKHRIEFSAFLIAVHVRCQHYRRSGLPNGSCHCFISLRCISVARLRCGPLLSGIYRWYADPICNEIQRCQQHSFNFARVRVASEISGWIIDSAAGWSDAAEHAVSCDIETFSFNQKHSFSTPIIPELDEWLAGCSFTKNNYIEIRLQSTDDNLRG